GADLPAVQHDAFADRLAQRIIGSKRRVDVVVRVERIRERLRVAAGLGDTESHVRARGRSGVADQRYPPIYDAGSGEIADRREERTLDIAQAIEKCGRHDGFSIGAHSYDEIFADERRWN